MKVIFLALLGAITFLFTVANADEEKKELPFDPAKISRLSLDGVPRSLSIRQGADTWLGYDLEKALSFKVWQAPKDKPGLVVKGFKTVSAGTTWSNTKLGESWQLNDKGNEAEPTVRYLGCTQMDKQIELSWELIHPRGIIQFRERVPTVAASGTVRVYRELRAESLKDGMSLVLPPTYRDGWELTCPEGKTVKSITGPGWHRISLR